MFATLARPRTRRASTLGGATSRIEVCPPAPRSGHERWWDRVNAWLIGDAPLTPLSEDRQRLEAVKREFALSIDDVEVPQAGLVLMRVNTAKSMRELWHLRAALYGVIALEHSQTEAERRLARLSRHFPTRSPRSSFLPLDG
jgi:hypothetical protein